MFGELKLLETFEVSSRVEGTFASDITKDCKMSLTTSEGTYVYHLKPRKENLFTNFLFKKYLIPVSTFDISAHLGLSFDEICTTISKDEVYEGIMTGGISASSNYLEPLEKRAVNAKWSPIDAFDGSKPILAVLNNTGSLNLYVAIIDENFHENYDYAFNITESYIEIVKSSWHIAGTQWEVLKNRYKQVKVTNFIWGNVLSNFDQNTFVYLLVLHKNGDLVLWKIQTDKNNSSPKLKVNFITKFSTNIDNITSLTWQHNKDNGVVFIGNLNGEIYSLETTNLSSNAPEILNLSKICSEKNEISVSFTKVLIHANNIFLIALKEPNLLVYLIDNCGKIKDAIKFHIGSYVVADVKEIANNKFLLVSCSGECQEIVLNVVNDRIDLSWRFVYINLNWSFKKVHSLFISPNNLLFGVFVSQSRLHASIKERGLTTFCLFLNKSITCEEVLWKSDCYRKNYDILEFLRVKSLSEKIPIPLIATNSYHDITLGKLRVLTFLSKVNEFVANQELHEELNGQKIISYDLYQTILNLRLCIERIRRLIAKGNNLSTFQLQSINLSNIYMKKVILDTPHFKDVVNDDFVKDLLQIILETNELEYPAMPTCFYCKESISGLDCHSSHFDTRCCISFMQVDVYDCLECSVCQLKMHSEVTKELDIVLCPYCEASVNRILVERPPVRREYKLEDEDC